MATPTFALYYSLRKIPFDKRDQIDLVHAFYKEIEDIVFECQDHEMALIKFNWWRSDVANLGNSSHPILIALQKDSKNLPLIQKRFLNIIDGFEQNSIPKLFEKFEDVVVYWMKTAGERELLINELLGNEGVIQKEDIYYPFMLNPKS